MKKKGWILLFVVFWLLPLNVFGERVTFESTLPSMGQDNITLRGELTKPEGKGPFPAVVLLHGCGGIRASHKVWAERLKGWGYVSLLVDSYGPRGHKRICADNKLMRELIFKRVHDARDARSFLIGLPFVDKNSLGLIGWSHGANSVLIDLSLNWPEPFRAGVAFYPYCAGPLGGHNAPLLILIGELDDWTPAQNCVARMPEETPKSDPEIALKVFPGAYHLFDNESMDMEYLGHKLKYNPEAANQAQILVKRFLDQYLH